MDKKRERLLDAAKKLLSSQTSEDEIIHSLTDVGVKLQEAQDIFSEAKGSFGKGSGSGFGVFVGKKKQGKRKGLFGGLFAKKQEGTRLDDLDKGIADFSGASLHGSAGEEGAKTAHHSVENDSLESLNFFETTVQKPPLQLVQAAGMKQVFREILPVRVSDFDKLIDRGGLKRGDTILLSGGCGTGKTTFSMQSLYNGALHGEKGVYITLEERPEKMRENLMQNYGWDLEKMEAEQKLAIIKIDPLTIARAVEATLTKERGGLYIELDKFELPFQFNLPFKPDRVVVDSLSALSIAFMENEQGYRQYLRHLFETLESYNSVNIVLGETEQEPGIYSRSGIEEFLADGVIVFYNVKIHNLRQRALEILKLRSSKHVRKLTPYNIGPHGVEIFVNQEIFSEN